MRSQGVDSDHGSHLTTIWDHTGHLEESKKGKYSLSRVLDFPANPFGANMIAKKAPHARVCGIYTHVGHPTDMCPTL